MEKFNIIIMIYQIINNKKKINFQRIWIMNLFKINKKSYNNLKQKNIIKEEIQIRI